MKLVLLSILFASVTCLPLPEEDIKSDLMVKENPIISKEPLKLEELSTPTTEKGADKKIEDTKPISIIETDKKTDEKTTNNLEEKKTTESEKEKKDTKENKVVIIEAKSVVNKEPEPMKNTEKDVKNEETLEKKEKKEKVEIPAIAATQDSIATSTIKPKEENMDSNSNESTEKNTKTESKEDIPSSESKESAESQENKS